jgi:two-component system LytT family response regulator
MRALLIDDERLARAELRRMLAAHPDVEIVGEAVNAADGLQQIAALRPELVFLDVQMPGGSGFDMLAALDEAPEVIFTTAFDRYALQAFEVNALDYLQKPIQAERMAAALQRCRLRLSRAADYAAAGISPLNTAASWKSGSIRSASSAPAASTSSTSTTSAA